MFSGAQHLVDVFFKEIGAELRLAQKSKPDDVADALDQYGDVLSPVALLPFVGAWWDRSHRAYKAARSWWKSRGSRPLRDEVAMALADLIRPIVVIADDIDRLSTEEIRDIFKLVRLTANFPNVIYLLCPIRPNVLWATDFQFNALANERRMKMLNIIDEFTREALGIEVGPDHVGAPLGLLVQAFEGVVRPDLPPVGVACGGRRVRMLPEHLPQ